MPCFGSALAIVLYSPLGCGLGRFLVPGAPGKSFGRLCADYGWVGLAALGACGALSGAACCGHSR